MKNLLVVLTIAFLGAVSAFGVATKPLIVKSSGGGFMMPELAGGEKCEVYLDRVVITNNFGFSVPTAAKVIEVRKVKLLGNFAAIIELAKAEKLETKPNNLCDGPSTSITVNPTQGEAVLLYSTGGCGSPRQSREGVASQKLRNIVGLYCPKTFDFSGEN